MNEENKVPDLKVETPAVVFGTIVHWVTIISCVICSIAPALVLLFPENNVLHPNLIFSLLWKGGKVADIWGGTIPSGHWYLGKLFTGDGLAMFGIALGCSSAFFGLVPAAILYLKRKNYIFTVVCGILILLMTLAMSGILVME